MTIEVRPVTGIGEVRPGDDVAALVTGAADWLRDGDVVVVTSKIVSKAEGRLVELPDREPDRTAAFDAVLAAETAESVASRGPVRIVRTHHGFVMAGAGIDASNVESSRIVLLPEDPDASARAIRAALRERHGLRVAVIVSDTMGRAWRTGQTDVALGAAGLPALRDHRGQVDPYGNELRVTEIAVVDQLAGAAELVKGKFDGVPVAVIRGMPGLTGDEPDGPGVGILIRSAAEDLFPLGSAEAHAAGLRTAATLPDHPPAAGTQPPVPPPAVPDLVASAIALVSGAIAPDTLVNHLPGVRGQEISVRVPVADPAVLVRLGGDLHRLRAALAAHGLTATVTGPSGGADDGGTVADEGGDGREPRSPAHAPVRIRWSTTT